ncbi:helix-turn-helix transcriptional regulator [Pelagibius sp. CAU 1746]|uniref:helix-turn-helix transcriptional regulator n=1 Tax=Pelagibius sp. CAU 1746 TaxID=3140370 RepID=UPI00325B1507
MTAEDPEPTFLTTREVAELLRVKERKVYDLASSGGIPCRRVTGKLLFPRAEIEAWLAGHGGGAARRQSVPANIAAGSHDPLLDWAIRESGSGLATFFDGSLDGLKRLQMGEAALAGLHVYEPERHDWNVAHVNEALGGAPVVLVEWARRQQGLLLSSSLDGQVSSVAGLAGRRVVRRQPSAGAGLLLDHLMAEAGISAREVDFLAEVARTETEAAASVASGQAEAAPGLQAMARQFGLAFLPTVEERFDLAVDRHAWFEPPFQRLLAFCRSSTFTAKAAELGGYDLSGHGRVVWNAP